MIRKSRMAVALGLVLALGVGAIAYADGAGDNTAYVDGSVKPSKLDKKKYKPINLFLGVRTEGPVTGAQANPEKEYISMGKNVKWNGNKAPVCTAAIEVPGLTAQQAADLCPSKSLLGTGEAEVALSSSARVSDIVVSVFNGPGKNEVRLHTSSATLGPAAPTVFGKVVKSDQGGKYGQMLVVDDAPDAGDDVFMITKFNATIEKSSKVATARCKAKKMLFLREVTYDDQSTETATLEQPCKRKGGKGGGK